VFAYSPIIGRSLNHREMKLINTLTDFLWRRSRVRLELLVKNVILNEALIYGPAERVRVASNVLLNNALFNTSSGDIVIEKDVFFGHNVCLLTGSHDPLKFGLARRQSEATGGDIFVKEGVWIASNVTVIGPVCIGEHAVLAAGAVVNNDVLPYTIVAGVPARLVRNLK
jgi:acetyltransferase-like isoleucine patch superfamily enzyme